MGITWPKIAVVALAAVMLAWTAQPLLAQSHGGRGVSRHGVAPYDSNMSMIDRMARRNMERRHIERRMRLAPPRDRGYQPQRRSGGFPRR